MRDTEYRRDTGEMDERHTEYRRDTDEMDETHRTQVRRMRYAHAFTLTDMKQEGRSSIERPHWLPFHC